MAVRYTDFHIASQVSKDFVIRKRTPTLSQLIVIFLSTLTIAVTLMAVQMDKMTMIVLLCILFGSIGCYIIVQIQRSRDLVMATEFQNALFASAMGFNNKFCLIVKREGNIIYMDNAFQKLFPDILKEHHLSIASLLKHGKVLPNDREKIFAAIERGVFDKVIFDIQGSSGQAERIVMSIEPILRPQGFILLRCREFIDQRAEDLPGRPVNPLLNKSSITLFSYIMDKMNMGVYMTDPTGNIIYANPILEQWLDYREGEVTSGTLSLKDIVHTGSRQTGAIAPGDFEGDVSLQKKVGGLMKAFVNQKIITSENEKVLGCVALVHNIAEQDAGHKKLLW